MKVLYIAPEYPSAGRTAAQVRANALLPQLAQRTDLQILAYPPPDGLSGRLLDDCTTSVERAAPGKLALLCATMSSSPRAFLRYNTRNARAELARVLQDFSPDVVHFDSIGTLALLDDVLAVADRPKIIAHTHDAVSRLYDRLAGSAPLGRGILTRKEQRKLAALERNLLPQTDSVIVDSEEDAAFLKSQAPGARVDLVPLGVDLNRFEPNGELADLGPKAVVFSGSMGSEQSADAAAFLAQKVMPRVWAEHPDAHLFIVGGNPTEQVKSLEADKVTVTGFVDDLTASLRAANVYACPLRLGSGMRTRVVEALACGADMVATSFAVRGLHDAESPDAPFYLADDEQTFAERIMAILDGRLPRRGESAVKYAAERYSWAAVADQICAIYDEIVVQ